MSEPETLDIIEEMRRFAKRHWMHDEGQNMRMFADRLEASYKRELGNAQKMREALTRVKKMAASYINCHDDEIDRVMTEIVATCDFALSAPPRNCDVGTADEQVERHKEWCRRDIDYSDCCDDCRDCFARWAEMPYGEGCVK